MWYIVNTEKRHDYKEQIQYVVIKNEIGFLKLNAMLLQQLCEWILVDARTELERVDKDVKAEIDLMYFVGALCHYQHEYNKAEAWYKKCITKRKRILGSDHPRTLKSMNSLATLYRNQGTYDKAEPLYKQCLEKRTTIRIRSHRFHAQYRLEYDNAEQRYKECLVQRAKILGPDHPDTFTSMNNLAAVCRLQGKYDDAKPLFKVYLATRKSILADDHPDTLISMNNLAAVYRVKGKYADAE
ncbi:hypothetical protein CTEN210_00791 [Chaetoceros tenuissimus]|uniref:Kinesin light chain n=1 Tax=Chaetoceros tenuissimus TaxID=426638 RepID=A0AAD3CDV3_9STRA|nr:hypothetical protein CTEN210_00791 [Chaetoceros tenuissimus]